jgi:hypothetical protein
MRTPPRLEGGDHGENHEQRTAVARQDVVSSRQVSWWSVHEFVAGHLDRISSWPMAGTPAWCALDDADPVKWAALIDAAQHWALRAETCQEAECEAPHEISAAAAAALGLLSLSVRMRAPHSPQKR